jgi:hypothetical protein
VFLRVHGVNQGKTGEARAVLVTAHSSGRSPPRVFSLRSKTRPSLKGRVGEAPRFAGENDEFVRCSSLMLFDMGEGKE